jgi:hypothetical protein
MRGVIYGLSRGDPMLPTKRTLLGLFPGVEVIMFWQEGFRMEEHEYVFSVRPS